MGKIAAAAAVNAALKPKLTAVVSAPVIEKEPEVEVAVAAPVEEVKVVALSAPVQEAEVVAVVPFSEKKVKVSVASAAEKPRLKSKAKAGGRRKKVQTYVAPVALDENGQPIDPRANDPVTLVKAYSDYNIFERTYDYGFESVDGIKIVAEGAAQHKGRRRRWHRCPRFILLSRRRWSLGRRQLGCRFQRLPCLRFQRFATR